MTSERAPKPMSETTKRLLGLRDFEPIAPELRKTLLGSEERAAALEAVDTGTMPRQPKREMKRNIVLEVLKQGLFSSELLREHPTVYIGSGTDIEFPLALGARHIVMVDTIFEDSRAIEDVIGRVEVIIRDAVQRQEDTTIRFQFNFGEGKENVLVQFSARSYLPSEEDGYKVPESTGAIILFASQGPGGVVRADELMKAKLVEGGVILEEADIVKIGPGRSEESTTLGKEYS